VIPHAASNAASVSWGYGQFGFNGSYEAKMSNLKRVYGSVMTFTDVFVRRGDGRDFLSGKEVR
jgi:hypothetical protein